MLAFPQTAIELDQQRTAVAPALPFAPALPDRFDIFDGRLIHQGIDLMSLVNTPVLVDGRLERPATPMYVRRLSALRNNYTMLHEWFRAAKQRLGYPGDLLVAYASKANPSQPVVRTLLSAGAAYECSSAFDVDILRHAHENGWVDPERTILANGFKIPRYADNLIRLRREGFRHVLPIFDDLEEVDVFLNSGESFEVGLRSRTDSDVHNRFGLSLDDMAYAAELILASDNLHLTTYHAMQTVSAGRGLQYQHALVHSLRRYAELYRRAPSLHRFNLGGGLPARTSDLNFADWMYQTLTTILHVCAEEEIPAPDLIIESGRYMVQDHAAKLFRIVKTRSGADGVPYYMIDGSIMSSFPDAWALGDQFTVLPVNNWDGPFQQVRLAGLTCDQDDVYPTRKMADVPLLLPVNTENLVVGFFDCGAYQETLGGRAGAKHCLLPEGPEVVLDDCVGVEPGDVWGEQCFSYAAGQSAISVLSNLGYAF